MTRQPLDPLPRQSEGEALTALQLVMLWILWAGGLTIAMLSFLSELMTGRKVQRLNDEVNVINVREVTGKIEHPALNVPVKGDSAPGKRNEVSKPTNVMVMEYNDYDEVAKKEFDFEMK